VTHFGRLGYILGTLLVGISTYLIVTGKSGARSRRRNRPPVTELAQELQQAWSVYHNR
jgi:hypothetical protein